jgi:arabinan endo-1,5-alpha-L-arabinosidase
MTARNTLFPKTLAALLAAAGVAAAIVPLYGQQAATSPAASAPAQSAPALGGRRGGRGGPLPPVDPAAAARLKQQGSVGVGVHDPSTIVECNGEYWTFYTGRGIGSWHSKDLVTWTAGPRVFANPLPWVTEAVPANRGLDFWAPDVFHLGDKYILYYSASTFGKNTSAIGVASNPTLDPNDPAYKWTDQGMVIQSGPGTDFNTIDPAIFQDDDKTLWMSFGSFWSGIRMIQLDPATLKRIKPDSPIYLLAHYSSIEASYIYKHDGKYYLFVNWGLCCRGVNSTYHMRVGRADKVTGPYLDKEGKDLKDGGGTQVLGTDGNFIGPGHAGIVTKDGKEYMSMHFYDETRRGASTLAIRPVTWSADGWPVVGEASK